MIDQAQCAHLIVKYDPVEHPNGTFSSRWRCIDCLTEFSPGRVIERIAQAMFPETKTLRDEFAMAALTGLVSDPEVNFGTKEKLDNGAKFCYNLADAMLEASK